MVSSEIENRFVDLEKQTMSKEGRFPARIVWTGNRGTGTSAYKAYDRTWDMALPGRAAVHCSNDPQLGGDPTKYNPEELLITALASCHMLWYLHLCAEAGVTVLAYEDNPVGIGECEPSGRGRFVEAILKPVVTISADSDVDIAKSAHAKVHEFCFIGRSVNFPVRNEPVIVVETAVEP